MKTDKQAKKSNQSCLTTFILSLSFIFLFVLAPKAYAVDCSVPISGDATINSTCSFPGTVNGVDAGTGTTNNAILTVTTGGSLTVLSGQKVVAGTITLTGTGTMTMVDGGEINIRRPLWMTDSDADGYPAASTTQIVAATAPVGARRRNVLTAITSFDYNDGSNTIYPGTACNGVCSIASTSGACIAKTAGKYALGTCTACDGVSLNAVNISAGADTYNDCTGGYNSCSGNNRIGPDGNCNGSGACNTGGLSDACATRGICQTGGGCSGGSCVAVTNIAAGQDNYSDCTQSYNSCSGDTRIGPDGNCNGSGACNTGGASLACATRGICQTGGGCSGGSCVAVSNVASGQDTNNECTASYNSCSGNSRIGPDGNCNGSGACNTGGLSNACATRGTCQTGGGCSGGSCVAVSNVPGGQDTNGECTAAYNSCSGNSRIGPDGNCNGSGSCNTGGLSDACATRGICQTGGGCSGGSCVGISNQGAGSDAYGECTASYNNCSGNNQIGPDGNCNGSGGCNTGGLSNACATRTGICQAGGGCSSGSCVAVSNQGAGSDTYGECTASYNSCSGNNQVGPDGNCNGSGGCNTGGLINQTPCATRGICQTGGGCSGGSCIAVSNQGAGSDAYGECTPAYGSCSGSTIVGPDGNCNGGGSCNTTGLTCPCMSSCIGSGTCYRAQTVPNKQAGTAVDNATVGTVTWSNPGNGTTANSIYSTAVLAGTAIADSNATAGGLYGLYSTVPYYYQSFTGNGGVLDNAKFLIKKGGGSPTGSAYATIFVHSGTFGSTSVPTGSAIATSDAFNVATLTTSNQWITFNFTGGNRITLANGTKYVVAIYYAGGNSTNLVGVSRTAAGTHSGNSGRYQSGAWFNETYDMSFYVYTATATSLISHYLKASNFGFSVPTQAAIDGVLLSMADYKTGTVNDTGVNLVNASGNIVGCNRAKNSTLPSSNGLTYYGASNDLWCSSWTPADINSSNFGVVFSATGTGTAYVDGFTITVYFTYTPYIGFCPIY